MDSKKALAQVMMNVEYYPSSELERMNIDMTEMQRFPIGKAAALGVAFQPLTQLVSIAMGGAGQSGLYFVNTAGKNMFKSGGQFIGNLQAANGGVGGGLARMTQLPLDPTMLCMAVAIMAIEKKLDVIQELQKEILAFLELKEEAKLKGNLNALIDILNNYKFNWDNEKYKEHKYILAQDIKREAEQSIILYHQLIEKELNKKVLFISSIDIKAAVDKTVAHLSNYRLALYIFSFSSFLEVMLLENFDSNYINSVASKIQEYADAYAELYEKYAEKIEKDSKAALEGYALKGLSIISSSVGKIVGKIPVISELGIDKSLLKNGSNLLDVDTNRTQNVMQILADNRTDYISPFIENLHTMDDLFNQPVQLMFDSENIYIAELAPV